MKKKHVVLVCLVVAAVLAFAGCGGNTADTTEATAADVTEETTTTDVTEETTTTEEEETTTTEETTEETGVAAEDLKVGIVMKSFDEFQNAVIAGATDAAMALGVSEDNIIALAPADESGITEQVEMIENCVSQGVDILLVAAQDPDASLAPLQRAADDGIVVVMVDTDCPDFADKVTYIGTDNYTAAHDGAVEFIETYMEEGQNIIILRGKLGDTNHDARTQGLEDACEECGVNVLEVQDANCESEKAANIMANMITKYGDEINGLLVTSDNMSIGAITSIKAVDMLEDVVVCGFDGFQVSIQAVADGDEEMIIAQKPYWMGEKGIECAFGSMEGETYEDYIDPGISIIDASNYEEFLE